MFTMPLPQEYLEMIAAVAIGVLIAVFLSAFVILIVICRRQKIYYQYKANFVDQDAIHTRPEVMLIDPRRSEMEEVEVALTNYNLDKFLENERWVDDATGVIPHCLTILKTCRFLTEKLTTLAMKTPPKTSHGFAPIVESAKGISTRVDDMVKSMYPPLDPRLLEARAAALVLAVTHLVTIAKYECGHRSDSLSWIDISLQKMEDNIRFLRDAAEVQDTLKSQQFQTSTRESTISLSG